MAAIKHILMFLYFHAVLKHLIKRNYRLRRISALNGDGLHPDEWYWADKLSVNYGYFVEFNKAGNRDLTHN